jgi:hypothetical protein
VKTVEFDFFSDDFASEGLCHIIVVSAAATDGYVHEHSVVIYDSTADCYRKLQDFSPQEQVKIDQLLEEYVNGYSD